MGLPALALRHVEKYPVGLYIQSPELPTKKDAPVKEPSESPPSNFEIDVPFGGWQIFKKPVHVENSAYSVELNPGHKNLSVFNDNDKLTRLKYELNWISSSSKVKHLVISFYGCFDANRINEIADFLEEKRISSIKYGRKLSLAHLEENLYKNTNLKSLDSFVHNNVADAIKNNSNHAELLQHENPTLSQPYLRIIKPDRDPADVSNIPGNYLG